MRTPLKIFLIIAVLGFVTYGILTVVANWPKGQADGRPSKNSAEYQVEIVNTGKLMYTSDYITNGRVYVLFDYWELDGDEYRKFDKVIILEETVFGPIKVRGRE